MARWAQPELVEDALRRDAVDALIAAIWPACFRLAATILGDRALAQDAAQEACVVVYRKVRGLRSAQAFDSWVYRIVVREAMRARPKENARPLYDQPVFPQDDAALDVWGALAQLPRDLRAVTVLYYFEELTSAQIASVLGAPHATVRTRLMRARDRLRVTLKEYSGDFHTREVRSHAY